MPPKPPSTLAEKARPTNADIAAELRRLHDCVHSVGQQVDRAEHAIQSLDRKIEGVVEDLGETREDVAHMKGVQEGISIRLGVQRHGEAPASANEVRPAMMMSMGKGGKTVLAVLGALGGIVLAYQILAVALPGILGAIHAALMMSKP